MRQRRMSIVLDQETLATLTLEAQRRQVSVAQLVREAIETMAAGLQGHPRPRVGVARSSDGRSAAEVTAEPTV